MNFDELETALGQHLAEILNCPPIAWANKDAPGAVPYLEVRNAPNTRENPTIDGTGPAILTGLFLVTVVTARNVFTGPANALAQDIADHFPKTMRLVAGDGNVVIYRSTEIAPGFTDGTHYRMPVRVFYTTEV